MTRKNYLHVRYSASNMGRPPVCMKTVEVIILITFTSQQSTWLKHNIRKFEFMRINDVGCNAYYVGPAFLWSTGIIKLLPEHYRL